jgi:hypothetical protein
MKAKYFLLALLLPVQAFSQEKKDEERKIDNYYVDFAVPDLAAYTLLGIESDQVARPGNLKELAIGLSSLTGTNGKFNPSLAIEYSPFMTLSKNSASKRYWKQQFRPANLAFSFGTQIDDSLGNRASLGFKWVPVDHSEPLGDTAFYNAVTRLLIDQKTRNEQKYISAYNDEVDNLLRIKGGLQPVDIVKFKEHLDIGNTKYRKKLLELQASGKVGSLKVALLDSLQKIPAYANLSSAVKQALADYTEELVDFTLSRKPFLEQLGDQIKELKEEYKKAKWNALVVQFSLGWVWNSDSATFDDLNKEKFTGFIGVSIPLWPNKKTWLAKHGQGILHVQYTNDKSALTSFESKLSAGARILIGNADNRFSLEGMYSDVTYDAKEPDGSELKEVAFRWSVGGEFKLSQGSWLEIALGGQKLVDGDTRILPSFSLKHALQNKRRFETN